MDAFVWQRALPPQARRRYIASVGLAAAALLCAAAAAWLYDQTVIAGLFLALSLFAVGHALMRWRSYRGRL